MTPRLFTLVTADSHQHGGFRSDSAPQPNAPRTVVIVDAQVPPVVRVGLLQSTLIELPAEEKVATVFGGDTVSWVFDAGRVASRYISIKPKVADANTDLHIVSDHGNEYTVELREVSSEKDNPHLTRRFISRRATRRLGTTSQRPRYSFQQRRQRRRRRSSRKRPRMRRRQQRQTIRRSPPPPRASKQATPARCTSITPGIRRRAQRLAFNRFGAMTSLHTCVGSFRKHRRCMR